MKSQPFKFRYVNRLAGAFLFIALVIVGVMFGLAGKAQQWFVPTSNYRVLMPKEGGTRGITVGSNVFVFGSHVGHVKKIELVILPDLTPVKSFDGVKPSDLGIVAILSVKGDFSNFIATDSDAVLKYDLGGLGAAYFDISKGKEKKAGENQVLAFEMQQDVKEEMVDIITELKNAAVPAVKEVKRASKETADLVAKLSEDDGKLFGSLAAVNANLERMNIVIKSVEKGEGALGLLLKDEATKKNVADMIAKLGTTATKLDSTVDRVDSTVASLGTGIDSINAAAVELPGIMQNTDLTISSINESSVQLTETMREAEVLTEGIQKHWLIRKNIYDPLEDPEPEPAGRTERSKTTASKKWKR